MRVMKKFFVLTICLSIVAACLTGCSFEDIDTELSYRTLGIKQMEAGKYDEAIESFEKALDQPVGKVRNLEKDIILYVAECMYRQGRTDEALERVNALLDYDNRCAGAHLFRGNIYLSRGMQSEALDDYSKAVKYDGGNFDIYTQIYENLMAVGLVSDANDYLDRALKLRGDSRYALMSKGYIYYMTGELETARDYLEQAVEKKLADGEDDKAELYLAQVLELLGEDDRAKAYYISYGDDHGDDPIVLAELGKMAMEAGDYEIALRYYQKGLQADNPPNVRELMQGEIAALEYTGDFEEAKAAMAQYILDYPDDEQAQREHTFLKYR